uniref:Protein MIX23 n=2 Tax=Cacopsylla melanoneura TaxID=428564 RepID=A0A8D8Y7G6_9HEMI
MVQLQCEDFLQFQDALKKMRDVDDKIIYILNSSLPTPSFKPESDPATVCQDLYKELNSNYETRSNQINKCIHSSAEHVRTLKSKYENNENDLDVFKHLKKEQNKLRMLKTEVNVEEVLRARTFKVFDERCRNSFKASANPL